MSSERSRTRVKRATQASPEWYTPAWLLERVAAFLGPGYLDPCPASFGVLADNGLAASWAGRRVYCNPPYGRDINPWIRKALTEPVRELVLLIPAHTDTRWFQPLFVDSSFCFIAGRVRFDRPGGAKDKAPHPSVLVYRGRRCRKFAGAFADLGPILRTYEPRRATQPVLLTA